MRHPPVGCPQPADLIASASREQSLSLSIHRCRIALSRLHGGAAGCCTILGAARLVLGSVLSQLVADGGMVAAVAAAVNAVTSGAATVSHQLISVSP